MSDVWGVAVPNWITAFGSLTTAGAVWVAMLAYRREVKRDQESSIKEDKRHANRVWASWVTDGDSWGLLIRNSLDDHITDFVIDCVGNPHKHGNRYTRSSIPPGEYFVLSDPKNSRKAWEYLSPMSDVARWSYVDAPTHRVTGLRFTHDSGGWRVLPTSSAGRLSSSEHQELQQVFVRAEK